MPVTPPAVTRALDHVRARYPDVTHVAYDREGRWFYFGDNHDAPKFRGDVDVGLLEDAADAVANSTGFPAIFCVDVQSDDCQLDNSRCPGCGSQQIIGHSVNIDGPRATQACNCADCDASWTDIYTLTNQEVDE